MNEIQEWLIKPDADYHRGIELFRKYKNHSGLLRTFQSMSGLRSTQVKLRYELTQLAKLPSIDPANPLQERISEIPKSGKQGTGRKSFPSGGILDRTAERFYPQRIQKAIEARAHYANRRDKYHRNLVENLNEMNESQRGAAITLQKNAHTMVTALTEFIRAWEKTGIVPDQSPLDAEQETPENNEIPDELTPEEREKLEGEFKILLQKRSKARKSITTWEVKKDSTMRTAKLQYFRQIEEKADERIREIAQKTGKRSWK